MYWKRKRNVKGMHDPDLSVFDTSLKSSCYLHTLVKNSENIYTSRYASIRSVYAICIATVYAICIATDLVLSHAALHLVGIHHQQSRMVLMVTLNKIHKPILKAPPSLSVHHQRELQKVMCQEPSCYQHQCQQEYCQCMQRQTQVVLLCPYR